MYFFSSLHFDPFSSILYETLNLIGPSAMQPDLPIHQITDSMIEDAYQTCRHYYDPTLVDTGDKDQFYQITVAYQTLINPSKRKIYDAYLMRHQEMTEKWQQ